MSDATLNIDIDTITDEQAIRILSDQFNKLGDQVYKAEQRAASLSDEMRDLIDQSARGIPSMQGDLDDYVKKIKSATANITLMKDKMQEAAQTTINPIVKVDTPSLSSGKTTTGSKAPSTGSNKPTALTKGLKGALGIAVKLGKVVTDILKGALQRSQAYQNLIQMNLQPFVLMLELIFIPIMKWFIPKFKDAMQFVIDHKEDFNYIGTAITKLYDLIIGLGSAIVTITSMSPEDMFNTLKTGIQTFIDWATTIAAPDLSKWWNDSVEDFKTAIRSVFDTVGKWLRGEIDLSTFVTDVTNAIWTAIDKIFGGLISTINGWINPESSDGESDKEQERSIWDYLFQAGYQGLGAAMNMMQGRPDRVWQNMLNVIEWDKNYNKSSEPVQQNNQSNFYFGVNGVAYDEYGSPVSSTVGSVKGISI